MKFMLNTNAFCSLECGVVLAPQEAVLGKVTFESNDYKLPLVTDRIFFPLQLPLRNGIK